MRRLPRAAAAAFVTLVVLAGGAQAATPRWVHRLDRIVAGRPMSVAVGNDGHWWYRHGAGVARPPASNEKLLLSMALFDRFGTGHTFAVRALAGGVGPDGAIAGSLYVRGQGDPEVGDARLDVLAKRLRQAGVRSISGGVVGLTGPFRRDWFAPGWKSYFPSVYVALPTALTFRGNRSDTGRHIGDPELRAARYLTHALRDRGIAVADPADAGPAVPGLQEVAAVDSKPLAAIVGRMDHRSSNFSAEVLGKALAYDRGDAGTIANAAAAICRYESAHGVAATCHDSSGLSYANRQTARGIVRLLWVADRRPWAGALRQALPDGGRGTLKGRLRTVRLHAKTGTLDHASALSGWVWSRRTGTWIEFALLTSGMDEWAAKTLEDKVVRLLAADAKPR